MLFRVRIRKEMEAASDGARDLSADGGSSATCLGELIETVHSPMRVEILYELGRRERCVGELAERLEVGLTSVSNHLRKMEDFGLVVHRPQRTKHVFRLSKRVELHDDAHRTILTLRTPRGDALAIAIRKRRSEQEEDGNAEIHVRSRKRTGEKHQ